MKIKVKYNLLKASISIFLALAIVIVTGFSGGINAYAATVLTVTDNGTNLVVETGAGLVYKINKTNGNLVSAQLNGGAELQNQTKGSQINSGLTTPTVTYQTFNSGSQVLITCATSTVTHYYASKVGDNTIYMATYITAEPSTNELYYIFRGNMNVLKNVPTYSDLRDNSGAIENTDVYGFPDGHTASKYFGNDQAKDLTISGVTGDNVGVFMAYGNRETSIGGPFQRDIQFQTASPGNMDTEVYNYMNSQHAQTDIASSTATNATYSYRLGLFGPYALCFTDGSIPSLPDYSWMSGLGLLGYVPDSGRGTVVLNGLSGMDEKYDYTIGFANTTAQYWAEASSTGAATCSGMKPGTYKMTVYKGELSVYTQNVIVSAGNTASIPTVAIIADPSTVSTIWRIGDWDGTPLEFDNGENIQYRHPSDSRNDSWGTSFAIGDSNSNFPAAQFRKGNNGSITITFNMTDNEIKSDHVLKIGYTTALHGVRPSFTLINSNPINPATGYVPTSVYAGIAEPISSTITLGTYRGNNATASYTISKGRWAVGKNTLIISPQGNISKDSTISSWLSGSYTFDCIELTGTPDSKVTGVTINQNDNLAVLKGASQQFSGAVSGSGSFDDSLNWSIITTTAAAANTKISNTGELTVASDEKLDSLKVRATSVADKNIYAEKNVKLIKPFAYGLNYNLTSATVVDIDIVQATATTGPAVTITFAPDGGYKLPDSITVKMDGNSSPSYDYDSKTGKLYIKDVTGDLTITVTGEGIVTTTGTTNIGQYSATLTGTVNPGNETVLDQGFEWKKLSDSNYSKLSGTLDGKNLTLNLPSLFLYTSYIFRAYVETNTGIGYGEEETFRTEKGTSSISSMSSSGGGGGGSSSSGILGTLEGEGSDEIDEIDDSTSVATSTIISSSSDTSTPLGQTGWVKTSDNNWYHVDSSTGSKNTGWLKAQDGNWYYLDKTTGAMQTGWEQTDDGNWYYLHNTIGSMQTGWLQTQDGIWYYLDKTTGAMKTGWIKTGEKWYYLNSNGSLAVNTTVDGYLVNKNGEWVN